MGALLQREATGEADGVLKRAVGLTWGFPVCRDEQVCNKIYLWLMWVAERRYERLVMLEVFA
jgi:hypothetical protein